MMGYIIYVINSYSMYMRSQLYSDPLPLNIFKNFFLLYTTTMIAFLIYSIFFAFSLALALPLA